ncbi:MAG TPA: hypothetical protein VHG89_10755 [Verrucomicrobiae bacterium]|nr:hypothetical protein [Verrucomicrobiae bacterium]
MNFFPQEHPFQYADGGYATLSFIPTLATMVLDLIVGNVLRDKHSPLEKVRWLAIAGIIELVWLVGWRARHLPCGKTHLDTESGAVQRRLLFVDFGGTIINH